MELDCSLGLINASPTHADFQTFGWPGTKNAKCESPLFGELANRLSMFLIRSDRAGDGNNQADFIALRRNGRGPKK